MPKKDVLGRRENRDAAELLLDHRRSRRGQTWPWPTGEFLEDYIYATVRTDEPGHHLVDERAFCPRRSPRRGSMTSPGLQLEIDVVERLIGPVRLL